MSELGKKRESQLCECGTPKQVAPVMNVPIEPEADVESNLNGIMNELMEMRESFISLSNKLYGTLPPALSSNDNPPTDMPTETIGEKVKFIKIMSIKLRQAAWQIYGSI